MTDSGQTPRKSIDRNHLIAIVIVVLAAVFIFARVFKGVAVQVGTSQQWRAALAAPGYPKTVHPPGGKAVTIPALPVRIVAANCGAADILAEMIDPRRFAAIPIQVEDYAADPQFWRNHTGIPRFEKFHAERILGYRPDLVVSSAFQDGSTTAAIQEQHVPILSLNDFESLDGIRSSITILGEAVGTQVAAAKMNVKFVDELKKIAAALKDQAPVTVVVYSNFGSGYTVGSGVCQDDIITHAGGVNLAAKNGMKGNVPLSFEQLLRMDPDYILVGGNEGLDSPQAKIVLNEASLKELRAVKNKHIAVVPQRWFDALSQHAVAAVKSIARQLHPEAKL